MVKRDLTLEEMKKPGRVLIGCDRLLEIVPLSPAGRSWTWSSVANFPSDSS